MIAISCRKCAAVTALAAVLASGCSAARPLHRSEASIRASLLKSTPRGTPKKEVIAKLRWRVPQEWGPFAAQAQEQAARNRLSRVSRHPGSPRGSDEVKSVLDFYFESYFVWFGNCGVWGIWGFDSEDHLLDIWVYKAIDSL